MIIFKLEQILHKINKTRYWLSKETGIDNNTLAKIYKNESKQIKLETMEKICIALDCNITDLIELKKD